jgi:hypothetical protein
MYILNVYRHLTLFCMDWRIFPSNDVEEIYVLFFYDFFILYMSAQEGEGKGNSK